MQKKLTLTIDEDIYVGLRRVIGPRKISHFVEGLVRPHVVKEDLYEGYRAMSADRVRESDALAWAEATCGDVSNEEI
ncbi:MAG: addiction module antitoxin [Candidatus Marinimicrobia bacterium]|nr:addiction module antitoxin [Candidatus Neomarinimicrobiota bacterium]